MKKIIPVLLAFFLSVVSSVHTAFPGIETVAVIAIEGNVSVVLPGAEEPVVCEQGMQLSAGTKVITGKRSYVEISFNRPRSQVVKVDERSEVIIKIDGYDKIELIEGSVFTELKDLDEGETFRVRTPGAVCGARGTAWLTEVSGSMTDVDVVDSEVFVKGINKDGSIMKEEIWVKAGQRLGVKRFRKPGKPKKISKYRMKRIDKKFRKPRVVPPKTEFRSTEDVIRTQDARQERIEQIEDKKGEDRMERLRKPKPRKPRPPRTDDLRNRTIGTRIR